MEKDVESKQASKINKLTATSFTSPVCVHGQHTAYDLQVRKGTRTPCPSNINQDQQTLQELLWLTKIMETLGKYSIHRYGAKDSHNICQYRSGKSNIHIG